MESAIYIVATPIGNLSDITLRALDVLKQVDVIAAEDTRHTRRLLDHYGVATRTLSLHEHNEYEKSDVLIAQVKSGQSVALVSDAGTPLISDPGYILVSKAKAEGVSVVPVPGPSALITALCASGIASDRFIFEGFLPAKAKAKEEALSAYLHEKKSVIFYESPHRIMATLELMSDLFDERELCIARELTKRYETIRSGEINALLEWMRADSDQKKGEFVLILSGWQGDVPGPSDAQKLALLSRLLEELPPKKASAVVADVYGGSKKEIYNMALSLKA